MTKKKKGANTSLVPASDKGMQIPVIHDGQIPDTYEGVRDLVQQLIQDGQKTALVFTWNIGKIIQALQDEHEANGADSKYGAKAVERIAEDVGRTPRLMQEMLRFYRKHEDIEYVCDLQLEWSTARECMRITDDKERKELEKTAADESLTVRQVRDIVNESVAKGNKGQSRGAGRQISAISWYAKLNRMTAAALKDIKAHMHAYPDMQKIVEDENRTTDEDYKKIVEGDDPLKNQIGTKATRLADYLRQNVVPIQHSFAESDED